MQCKVYDMLKQHKKWIVVGLIVTLILLTAGLCVGLIVGLNQQEHSVKGLTRQEPFIGKVQLSVADLLSKWKSSSEWRIVDDTLGRKFVKINNQTLEVKYPKNSYIPSAAFKGGFQFYAQPKVFPSKVVTLHYKVKFPSSFNWVKGGKLPGIWFGNIGANGGTHIDTGSSFRMMWRQDGLLEAYLYVPKLQHQDLSGQPGYVGNDVYGISVWRGVFKAQKGVWNSVQLQAKMNDPGVTNGVMSMTVNNTTMTFSKMIWSVVNMNVSGIMMHTFFGGNDASWATPTDQCAYFKDFEASSLDIDATANIPYNRRLLMLKA